MSCTYSLTDQHAGYCYCIVSTLPFKVQLLVYLLTAHQVSKYLFSK